MKRIVCFLFAIAALMTAVTGCKHERVQTLKEKKEKEAKSSAYSSSEVDSRSSSYSSDNSINRGTPRKLNVSSVTYGKSLAPQAGNTYEAKNLIDGNNSTAWAVHLDRRDIYDNDMLRGPVFRVNGKEIAYITVKNGYGKNTSSFQKNTRAAIVKFYTLDRNGEIDKVLYDGPLQDKPSTQKLDVSMSPSKDGTMQIMMAFEPDGYGSYYPGEKWNDLCINEVEFYGY